jgi:hypothetical protein
MDKEQLNYIFKIYQKKFNILENVYIKFTQHSTKFEFFGRSHVDVVGEFESVGKNRFKNIKPNYIELVEGYDNILFTLLHEIAHCISKYRERKIKDEWISLYHGDDFYKNYLEVIKIAYDNNIIDKKITIDNIKKFDKSW